MKRSKKTVVVVLLAVGLFMLVFGIVFKMILDAIVDKVLREKLALNEGTIAYKMWLKPPVPISFNIYVFDVINAKEVEKGLEQPVVVEKGPYVHRMHIHKTNVTRHDENDTISYVQPQMFHYDREASVGGLNDTFTTVNIPYITIASSLQHWPGFIQTAVNNLCEAAGESAFKKLTINDIFWGYEDPLLKVGYEITKLFGIHLPYLQEKFGFFYEKNNTGDGYYNVFSAVNGNLDNYCDIDFWNYERKMNLWSTDEANTIAGTDGSMHPPYITSTTKLKIFDAYLHRTLNMVYVKDTSYKGLDTLHFAVPFSDFANASVNPRAAGFCTPNTDYCIPSGAYNLSVASFGAPMFVSMPHFVGGDPYYQRQVLGMHPDPEKHQPFYDIHALTGVSIKGSRRYQINVQTKSFEHFSAYKNVPLSYLPIIWIDGLSVIDDENVSKFRDEIQLLLKVMTYVRAFIIGIGALLLVIDFSLGGYWYYKYKKECRKDNDKSASTKGTQNGSALSADNVDNSVNDSEKQPLLK